MYLNIPMFNAALIVLVYTYTTKMYNRYIYAYACVESAIFITTKSKKERGNKFVLYDTYLLLLNAFCVTSPISSFLIQLEH